MHNLAGTCTQGTENIVNRLGQPATKQDIDRAVQNVKAMVVVGTFIVATTGKSLDDLKESDIPKGSDFILWGLRKGLDVAHINYDHYVALLLTNLI
jgi:hypothetical protein